LAPKCPPVLPEIAVYGSEFVINTKRNQISVDVDMGYYSPKIII
jgi:hypothetical protein